MARRPEIDKEAMFRKIMPEPGISHTPRAPRPAEESPQADPKPEAESAPLRRGRGVPIRKEESQILINVMEEMVVERLDAAFAKFNCCKCDKCRKDVAAIALNKLPPKYVVAEESKLLTYTATIRSADVTTAIVQAILQVRAHPRHQ